MCTLLLWKQECIVMHALICSFTAIRAAVKESESTLSDQSERRIQHHFRSDDMIDRLFKMCRRVNSSIHHVCFSFLCSSLCSRVRGELLSERVRDSLLHRRPECWSHDLSQSSAVGLAAGICTAPPALMHSIQGIQRWAGKSYGSLQVFLKDTTAL